MTASISMARLVSTTTVNSLFEDRPFLTSAIIGVAILLVFAVATGNPVHFLFRQVPLAIAKASRWTWFSVGRFLKRRMKIGSLAMWFITFALAALLVGIPRLPSADGSWMTFDGWRAALFDRVIILPLFIAATLKLLDRVKLASSREATRRNRMRLRRNAEGRLVSDVHEYFLDAANQNAHSLQRLREKLLRCVVENVMEVIDAEPDDQVSATLLTFKPGDPDVMVAVARSGQTRDLNLEYPFRNLVAGDAIQNGKAAVEHDIYTARKHLRKHKNERTYRSIIAWPIKKKGAVVCFGALSVDSNLPYAFQGKRTDLESCLSPYLSALACTFPDTDTSRKCNYGNANL